MTMLSAQYIREQNTRAEKDECFNFQATTEA